MSTSSFSDCTIRDTQIMEDWSSPSEERECGLVVSDLAKEGLKKVVKSTSKVDRAPSLPADIVKRIQHTSKMPKYSAVAKALTALPSKEDSRINPETLDREKLSRIASQVNAAPYLHFTGNCALLSACLLYNLIHNEVILGAGNTYPVLKGLYPSSVQMLLFGEMLNKVSSSEEITSVDALEKAILSNYKSTGERYYLVSSQGYQVPFLGSVGHDFNAVVLKGKDNAPYVQFVDAWKTLYNTPSKETLANRYRGAEFSFMTFGSNQTQSASSKNTSSITSSQLKSASSSNDS